MQREGDQGRPAPDFDKAKSELSERLQEETQSATRLIHDASDEVVNKAGKYASEAQEALSGKAQETQRDMSASLAAFGGALRAASEHLANCDQATVSKVVLTAAGGLERLSSSLRDKPVEQVLGEVRSFGRENSGVLFAGSVLAGLALGRFIKSSPPADSSEADGRLKSGGVANTVRRPKTSDTSPRDDLTS
ncbi:MULTISPECIES: hypothetical protein [unclassified Mesorhizobium]|uniref:hypothetical protein n=1 Tax=unclassified Mesorhizobium TaxID=325217 RepID=UPI00112CD77E|nr:MULTISPECIES: hypothetical protein [unclassified Mesorhizobium]TPM07368.1 hypothetical protein FJ939_10095 [Mesorhizobium sp. B2-3-8]TPM16078.1 hypothetical protein FJ940_11910 [Mesorhizobium sp. B2-3-7]